MDAIQEGSSFIVQGTEGTSNHGLEEDQISYGQNDENEDVDETPNTSCDSYQDIDLDTIPEKINDRCLDKTEGDSISHKTEILSYEPANEPQQVDEPIENDISFDDFMSKFDDEPAVEESSSESEQPVSVQDDEVILPEVIEVEEPCQPEYVVEPANEPQQVNEPIENDISLDDFATRLDDEPAVEESSSESEQPAPVQTDEVILPEVIEVEEPYQPEYVAEPEIEPQQVDEPIENDISFDDFMSKLDDEPAVEESSSESEQPAPVRDDEEILPESKEMGIASLLDQEYEQENAAEQDVVPISEGTPDSSIELKTISGNRSSGFELDEMFGEQPKMNYTIYSPDKPLRSSPQLSWFEKLKQRSSNKKKKKS